MLYFFSKSSNDGVLTGVLARNALTRGAFRSAAGLHLADVYDVQPLLSDRELPGSGAALADRVLLLRRGGDRRRYRDQWPTQW